MLLLGLVGMVGYHILFFTALKYTLTSKASMLAAMNSLLKIGGLVFRYIILLRIC